MCHSFNGIPSPCRSLEAIDQQSPHRQGWIWPTGAAIDDVVEAFGFQSLLALRFPGAPVTHTTNSFRDFREIGGRVDWQTCGLCHFYSLSGSSIMQVVNLIRGYALIYLSL